MREPSNFGSIVNHACETLLLDKYGISGTLKFFDEAWQDTFSLCSKPETPSQVAVRNFFRGSLIMVASGCIFFGYKVATQGYKVQNFACKRVQLWCWYFPFARTPVFHFLNQANTRNTCIIIRICKVYGGCAVLRRQRFFPIRGKTVAK